MSDVHVFPTHEALSRAAAQHIVAHIQTVLARESRYALALAGGSTPERTYELLAKDGVQIDWDHVDIFWGDERFVPPTSEASNAAMARRTLLAALDIPADNVHPIPTDTETPEAAARQYEKLLQDRFSDAGRTFDLAVLGIGSDGHTASLFPETAPSEDDERWVRAVTAPPRYDITDRISCTVPVFNQADEAVFLASGGGKREAVARAFEGDPDCPAARITPQERLTWYLDEAANPS